jgi:hypothetical protein
MKTATSRLLNASLTSPMIFPPNQSPLLNYFFDGSGNSNNTGVCDEDNRLASIYA